MEPRDAPIGSVRMVHPFDIVRQAAYVGATAAVPGLIFGATYGTLRTRTPILFSLASGTQWFLISSTFWATRSTILSAPHLQNWYNVTRGSSPLHSTPDPPSASERLRASALAGALTGAPTALFLRGPGRIVQGALLFSLAGWSLQRGYIWLDEKNSAAVRRLVEIERRQREPEATVLERILSSRWSPVKKLSDIEHKEMMRDMVLKMRAESELISARIERLKREAAEEEAKLSKEEREERERMRAKRREEMAAARAERIAKETPEEREFREKGEELRKRFYSGPKP